jgi:hypothetical protein
MEHLNTQTVPTQVTPPMQASGGYTHLNPTVTLAKPLSYEFRVAEFVKDGKVMEVKLQVATFEHDNYGVRQMRKDFTNVERIQLPYQD